MMSIFKNFKNVEIMRVVEKIKSVFYYQVLERTFLSRTRVLNSFFSDMGSVFITHFDQYTAIWKFFESV